jgi:hypothetical protein
MSDEATNRQPFDSQDAGYRSALEALIAAYRPVLEEELKRAHSPEDLAREAEKPRTCDEEIELANRIFSAFFTEKVAESILGPDGRKIAGPLDRWRWCFLHIRCCIIFGWLLCRGPRTFRAFAYYLYRYWLCVREVIGRPVQTPLTDEQRDDFQRLVGALAGAYRPYLDTQLSSVEFPHDIPDEVLRGKIDCFEGGEELGAVFDRLLSMEAASALFGREAFADHIRDPFFRFCRCWCLCSIRFGCCLAGARSFVDVIRCLISYIICVRNCFRPLIAEIDTPAEGECAEATLVSACANLIAVPITGTATGSAFTHYTLRYSWGGGPLVNDAVVYPNCGRPPAQTSFATAVVSGILGYLDLTMLPAGETEFEVTLDVFGSGGLHLVVTRSFKIKTTAVEITEAAQVGALVAHDPFHPATAPIKLIKAVNDPNVAIPELSIGGTFTVTGSAYIVGCDRIMSQFVLGLFAAPPAAPVASFPDASGSVFLKAPVIYADNPSHPWQSGCFPVVTPNTTLNGNLVAEWGTNNCVFPPGSSVPKVKGKTWPSAPNNGRFVILLEVRDRLLPAGPFPGVVAAVDQVAVWIDNRDPAGAITSIGGVSGCGDLHLKDYLQSTADILGTAYDPPIDASAPQQRPNDNFGGYALSFQKNGGGGGVIPALTPNTRVPNVWPGPPAVDGTLAQWDIVAALDGGPGPLPPGSPKLARGERCAYVITLTVWDTTHVGDSGSNHSTGPILYAINIINDVP